MANHSVRKTGIGRLLDSDVPEVFVAQHSGMKNTDSLKSYKTAGVRHQIKMSNILNGITADSTTSSKVSFLFFESKHIMIGHASVFSHYSCFLNEYNSKEISSSVLTC